jgi:hypothetical protein
MRKKWSEGDAKQCQGLQIVGVLKGNEEWDFILSNGEQSSFNKGVATNKTLVDFSNDRQIRKVILWYTAIYEQPANALNGL